MATTARPGGDGAARRSAPPATPPPTAAPRPLPWLGSGFQPLLYFSTNTGLAYRINQLRYGGRHFVWCSPILDANCHAAEQLGSVPLPASSTPLGIYDRLTKGCLAEEDPSDPDQQYIEQKRASTLLGAEKMRKRRAIDTNQYNDIVAYVSRAERRDFLPVLYVIPADRIDDRRLIVPPTVAHPFSMEVQIHELLRDEFEIIRRPLATARS